MNIRIISLAFVTTLLATCKSMKNTDLTFSSYPDLKVIGAMKNVMWKGELEGIIDLDTISNKAGLYGIGPLENLRGEILINKGTTYISKSTADSTILIKKGGKALAPFFVYTNVNTWNEIEIPKQVKSLSEFEDFLIEKSQNHKKPFAFKLIGKISSAEIHIQNLPLGSKVSSPKEAHQGQVNYHLDRESVEIVGFFSTDHQGVFTHHDTYIHMHLITKDERQMGHLDQLQIEEMNLFLPNT